jgi:glycosyltransferase involved in cell wall biosynthesis
MINGLVERGKKTEIWIYNPSGLRKPSDLQRTIADSYSGRMLSVRFLDSISDIDCRGTIVATDFGSALLAKYIHGFKRYCYFVQDHEPEFNPTSFLSEIAHLTYSQPYECICCGPWLYELMTMRYKLVACQFELAYDHKIYMEYDADQRPARFAKRRIAFYYQPSKVRRLAELGLIAFDILADRGIRFHIDFFGEAVNCKPMPYSASYHGLLDHEGLAALYNKSAVGLVFSATNYSIIPREMMACGLPIIEYEGQSSLLSLGTIGVELVEACPYKLADMLTRLLADYKEWDEYANQSLQNVQAYSWERSIEDVCSFLVE